MCDRSVLKRQIDTWADELYPSVCYGIHPVIEEGKKTEMEEDEDE